MQRVVAMAPPQRTHILILRELREVLSVRLAKEKLKWSPPTAVEPFGVLHTITAMLTTGPRRDLSFGGLLVEISIKVATTLSLQVIGCKRWGPIDLPVGIHPASA